MSHLLNCEELAGQREKLQWGFLGRDVSVSILRWDCAGKTGKGKYYPVNCAVLLCQGITFSASTDFFFFILQGMCVYMPCLCGFIYLWSDTTEASGSSWSHSVSFCWMCFPDLGTHCQQSPRSLEPSVTCLPGLPYTICPQAVAAIWSTNKSHLKVCPNFLYTKGVRART